LGMMLTMVVVMAKLAGMVLDEKKLGRESD
jgi:hypothetical protein